MSTGMTYAPNINSDDPAEAKAGALLDSLRHGIPLPRARLAAGYRDAAALAEACRVTPGLEEACGVAEADGRSVRAEREREASDARVKLQCDEGTRGPTSQTKEASRDGARVAAGDARNEDVRLRSGVDCEPVRGGGRGERLSGLPLGPVEARSQPDGVQAGGASAVAPPETIPQLAARLDREARAEAARLEAEREGAALADREPDNESSDRWAHIREEAFALAPGLLGYALWVDRRRVDSRTGLYAMDPAWIRHLDGFYASGEFEDIGRFGVRAAKSDTICTAITGESLLIRRKLAGSVIGVCPVMSANMREAGGRFDTIKANLRACGFRDLSGSKAEVEPFSFKASGGGSTALKVETDDSQGHRIEFRVYPASEAGAAGFTGIAGFGDELDLWGKDTGSNPAAKVLRVLRSRYTTQPEAKLHLMSATYDRNSEHARLVAAGNVPGQYVARLGKEGAAKDFEDRMRLAAKVQCSDPLLLAPPLPPECPDIPSWVTNPVAPIEDAYKKAKGDIRLMFALWGGRLDLTGSGAFTLDDAMALLEMNQELSRPLDLHRRSPDGLFDYGLAPGVEGRYRGL